MFTLFEEEIKYMLPNIKVNQYHQHVTRPTAGHGSSIRARRSSMNIIILY